MAWLAKRLRSTGSPSKQTYLKQSKPKAPQPLLRMKLIAVINRSSDLIAVPQMCGSGTMRRRQLPVLHKASFDTKAALSCQTESAKDGPDSPVTHIPDPEVSCCQEA